MPMVRVRSKMFVNVAGEYAGISRTTDGLEDEP